MLTADPDADLEGALADWQRFRRRKRLTDVHWVDALYQAYLAGLLSGAAILGSASIVGDDPVRATDSLVTDGRHLVGIGVAILLAVALRSGARGGPLALERAEVRHVLLSPVDRVTALRSPALHQLRFLAFAAALVGASAGHLADRRMPGNGAAWTAAATVAAVTAVALAHGLACCAAGIRLRPWLATAIGLGLIAWSIGAATGDVPSSPTEVVGGLALWELDVRPVDIAGPVAAVLAVLVGLRVLGGVSLERLERRSRLVGQIRFAATLQDLRTVVVLRRQLAQERPRNRPWLRPRLPRRAVPVVVRDIRSLLRWPSGRIARLVLLGAVAGIAIRAAWDGTTPLVVVAGIALFLAGLDAAEPLGQELDHPTRGDAIPVEAGWVNVRHLPAIAVVSIAVAAVAAVAAVLVDPIDGAWAVAAVCVVPAGLGAAAGAVVNLVSGVPAAGHSGGVWEMAPPEAAGVRIVFRTAWPPLLATLGLAPVLVARAAAEDGHDPVGIAAGVGAGVIGLFALVAGWVRVRDAISTWWAAQTQQARARAEAPS